MSKKMTPCEKLGYKVGDEFEVISHHAFKKGQVVTLHEDDGTECPLFAGDGGGAGVFDGVECSFATLNKQVRKIANKLKPAKQALADAIHQNGGWVEGGEFAAQDKDGQEGCAVWFYSGGMPYEHNDSWYPSGNGDAIYGKHISCDKPFVNWSQTVLSRDEYLTAYPEQVKVEVRNETQHKVEVEMKSESEVTIKVGDWHKNGELPPVGEVCIFDPTGGECYFNEDELRAQGHQVSIIAHTKYKQSSGSVAVFKWDLDECCGVGSANACSFRPLRTERDKAIDEMMEHCDYLGSRDFAGKLFDAGYRKEVK